jgi:hypothetical protein
MRFHRDQYLSLLSFEPPERQMFVELFGPLVGLDDEWRSQGATESELSLTGFGWDHVSAVGCGAELGCFPASEPVVIEETREYRISRDGLGRMIKLVKDKATIGLPLNYPVKTMDDWLRIRHLYEFRPERIDRDAVERSRRERDSGAVVVATIPGAWETPRELMGDEAACVCYYEQPELMADILGTLARTVTRTLEILSISLTIDIISAHEDLAGKSGPLVGPTQVAGSFKPYYTAVVELMKSRGTQVFQMDSDGDINALIPSLLDCGLTCLYPMEPAAGMDAVAVRKMFGTRFAMLGGIDKHVLRRSRSEIRRELEYKMQPLMQRGGMVFGLDHRIPNGTPLANYRYYVDAGREILGLPPVREEEPGWGRMAL